MWLTPFLLICQREKFNGFTSFLCFFWLFTLPSLANQPMAARISVSAIWLLNITGEPYKQIIGYFDWLLSEESANEYEHHEIVERMISILHPKNKYAYCYQQSDWFSWQGNQHLHSVQSKWKPILWTSNRNDQYLHRLSCYKWYPHRWKV